ncbi:sortase [Candidatus Peregrinibacteria bacterium]|nr:sortase [Candidatus Peregrinibacteria bacterium]
MRFSRHHAFYDTEGNIILPDSSPSPTPSSQNVIAKRTLREFCTQYLSLIPEACSSWKNIRKEFHNGLKTTWAFLWQPVWIPGRNFMPKQMSRCTLFMLDVLRFGSTFAVIFLSIFVSLNFESFWEIAQKKIDPFQSIVDKSTAANIEETLRDKLKLVPSLSIAGRMEGNILSFLPPVGPPDDRLIIPALNLNVPIVIPSNASLLVEDWDQLEIDIQKALEDGVVHYPGTARPGQAGNFFLTGHSSYYPWATGAFKSVFARLPELTVGDEYWVYYGGDRHRYIIREKNEVRPSMVSVLDQPTDKRLSTLMTCTPVGTTLRRLVLKAQELDPISGLLLDIGDRALQNESLPLVQPQMLPI